MAAVRRLGLRSNRSPSEYLAPMITKLTLKVLTTQPNNQDCVPHKKGEQRKYFD